ncbi:MAG: hypothetical protein M1830_004402 [Pleopsidium flavum]|nr:MAG: hypothetical protein M1830_004402 [Pleopsidium flavum]
MAAQQDDLGGDASTRRYKDPYTSHHPVPTVQRYQQHQEQREAQPTVPDGSRENETTGQPYESKNLNAEQANTNGPDHSFPNGSIEVKQAKHGSGGNEGEAQKSGKNHDTPQSMAADLDPRQKRKSMKNRKENHAGREVTDPVTHLPVTIHDSNRGELENAPENLPPTGSEARSSTNASKSRSQLNKETDEEQDAHRGMEQLFPPPSFDSVCSELARTYEFAITVGLGLVLAVVLLVLLMSQLITGRTPRNAGQQSKSWLGLLLPHLAVAAVGLSLGCSVIWGLRGWLKNKVKDVWEDEVWDAARGPDEQSTYSPTPESTQWLNYLLASIWPLVNPDLFTSLADTLEDVMQASLPKFVRMISVEDLGQGSESIRILGVRWLPTGAAAQSVSVDGKLKPEKQGKESDRTVPGQGEVDDDTRWDDSEEHKPNESHAQPKEDEQKEEGDEENIAEGLEAEEGDFVNVEVAFAYRARTTGAKDLRNKSKNAHLFLAFYLPGSVRFPVWVELRGIIGTLRMRLQLIPDPPFIALCTFTLLGQPKTDLSCVPLTKRGLNIMDLPIISSFVQSSVDAALAEYVAPKSLTLDLKDMLVGDDFKKDTNARGVVIVRIKRAQGFKEGDGNLGGLKKGSSDPYVAVGWAKFGKPVWSTRVILEDMEPIWDETTLVLVGPEELNAEERLRVQLWDSDRLSADDDLGRIEVDLKELMKNPRSNGKMWDRQDGFMAMDADEKMPGSLDWSVGYFSKTRIQPEQLERQTEDSDVKTFEQLKDKLSREAERKLREASDRDESGEIEKQKAQDLKAREDKLVISQPPPSGYPTGIFSIQIHQITGLEYEKMQKQRNHSKEDDEEMEDGGDLPSSYCTVILNHQMIFKTRTKPKNAKPFFNAGTERPIRDWRTTEVVLSVRDSRVHEDDPLLGIVYIPLGHIFRDRSQINDTFPLVGGIGYGRARISMVFRSIQLQAPKELLGWDYGTLEVTGPITSNDLPSSLRGLRLKLRTAIGKGKMTATGDGTWTGKKDRKVRIAVRKRYCSCLVIEFRKNVSLAFDKTPAFAVFWLKDIPDDEERTLTLPVWTGDTTMKRAEANCAGDLGGKAGHINLPLKFWHGLSGYHKNLASKNRNMQNVFEILDTANDNKEIRDEMAGSDDDDDANNSSDSDNDNDGAGLSRSSKDSNGHDKQNQVDGSRGPWDQIKDYKDHSEQLHRHHRGLMQWKGARTAKWVKTKVLHGRDHVLDKVKHHERDPGIETEV